MIAALAGGVGAARFLVGLVQVVDPTALTIVVNVADDHEFHGLHVSPDLDSVTYALGGANNRELGWGRAGETFRTVDELARFGVATWFRLGDLDLATHLYRTEQLRLGRSLSDTTNDIVAAFGITARVLPATDDRVRTIITTLEPGGREVDLAMQEWFVRDRCEPPVTAVRFDGAETARPAPGVMAALETATTVVLCPSNPVISIGPLLALTEVRAVLEARREQVVGVSPIIAGAPVKGPADRLMGPAGIDLSCVGVAANYRDICATFVIDSRDAHRAPEIEALGVRCVVADTIMRDAGVAAALAATTLAAVA